MEDFWEFLFFLLNSFNHCLFVFSTTFDLYIPRYSTSKMEASATRRSSGRLSISHGLVKCLFDSFDFVHAMGIKECPVDATLLNNRLADEFFFKQK